MDLYGILSNNGTIINQKVFDYEIDKHEIYVTITVHDRTNQVIKTIVIGNSHRTLLCLSNEICRFFISD